ncbi:MAG TPA: efflux RND transporter periplasmic adaptor subunit [Verrucomicrobiae bacterium]|nr:efflux RND transporter periplasmic adaptor subunit [Verrucomicrobiae bacterium]
MKSRVGIAILLCAVAIVAVLFYTAARGHGGLRLTGIVTTDAVVVASEIQGRLQSLSVNQGDRVEAGQLLGRIQPQEWKADMSFYSNAEGESAAQVTRAEADLKYQETQTTNQINQAEANLASAKAQVTQADADLENARLNFDRLQGLFQRGVESAQAHDQARTSFEAAKAHAESLRRQVQSAEAALALAQANADQVSVRRAMLEASRRNLAAANAQKEKAQVRLDYTQIHAPISGIIDVRAALQGEVVNPGQPILTIIDPDNLWIRVDVEESYIDRIRLGEKVQVQLPSGATREGTIFYRAVDADYATQRDVSRSKRDIKTFEIRVRADNKDRALAVGMTAYVELTLPK